MLAVVAAALAGGYGALATFAQTEDLSIGEIRLSVSPGHRGALDLYVPLVDWGARFEAIKAPARLRIDLRTVNRDTVAKVAQGGKLDVRDVREEATQAITSYLRGLIAVCMLVAAALGILVAVALRSRSGPRPRATIPLAVVVALAVGGGLFAFLPPRGSFDRPQYYAHGADIPRALEAVDAVERSTKVLDQELDAQLVGLARLVATPADRAPLAGRPRVTVASDLHNNVLAIPILERTAAGGPILFPGDLTDRGSPLETSLVRRIAHAGRPFVFVAGNHDSDTLEHALARAGAIVLREDGQLKADGSRGPVVVTVGGLRVAGYADPFERRSQENFRNRFQPTPTPEMQDAFTSWLGSVQDRVDVVMVHEPALIAPALAVLRDRPPSHRLVFLVGHSHVAALAEQPGVTVINDGTVGAGGTGNLAKADNDIGIARLVYSLKPRFTPLAADLVSIDPRTGSATARRARLDDQSG